MKSKIQFLYVSPPQSVKQSDWEKWSWQMQNSLTTSKDFTQYFELNREEKEAFSKSKNTFRIQSTPYYAQLVSTLAPTLRTTVVPQVKEFSSAYQQMSDPLAEKNHSPTGRIIHRYSDRVLFLITDFCCVYCRFCTRKHFTGASRSFPNLSSYEKALDYIRCHSGVREVILSGGDPLTLSNSKLKKVLEDLSQISHIELIRIGTKMPVVNPYRIDDGLCEILREVGRYQPVYFMHHFTHPKEITQQSAAALEALSFCRVVQMNQMVLLNGVNNHPAVIQALSRQLLYLRVKPYYMFQCDPSEGTDHLRTSVPQALELQSQLWGHLSGLAMWTLCLDIPQGGGKVSLVPNFLESQEDLNYHFKGWDGVRASYVSPPLKDVCYPEDVKDYLSQWKQIKEAKKKSSFEKKDQSLSSLGSQA